jgi:PEP-CTERM motif
VVTVFPGRRLCATIVSIASTGIENVMKMKNSCLLAVLGIVTLAVAAMPARAGVIYSVDDGTGESGLGGFNEDIIHLNSFTSVAGGDSITAIQAAFGELSGTGPANGTPVTALIWSDPNNDGNPADAVLLDSVAGVVAGQSTNFFVQFDLNSPVVIPVGDVFFVGIRNNGRGTNASVFDTYRDTDSTSGQGWEVRSAGGGDIDVNNLGGSTIVKPEDIFTPGGNFMIRALGSDSAAVPEPSTAVLGLAGLIALGLWRARRAA